MKKIQRKIVLASLLCAMSVTTYPNVDMATVRRNWNAKSLYYIVPAIAAAGIVAYIIHNLLKDPTEGGLEGACKRGSLRGVQMILEDVRNIDGPHSVGITNGCPPLHFACAYGNLDIVKWLVEEKGADVNNIYHKRMSIGRGSRKQQKLIPLYVACEHGKDEIVQYLLEKGANVDEKAGGMKRNGDIQEPPHNTHLYIASVNGYTKVVKYLLDAMVDVEVVSGTTNETPLLIASKNGHLPIVELLLDAEANARATDSAGKTALHKIAERSFLVKGHKRIVRLLVQKGANIESRDPRGKTPLGCVAQYGNIKMFEVLRDHGARLDALDDKRNTLLHLACQKPFYFLTKVPVLDDEVVNLRGRLGIVKKLIALQADVSADNADGLKPIHIATEYEIVRYLLEQCQVYVNESDTQGNTILHKGRFVGYLLRMGADPAVKNNAGNTPLHTICSVLRPTSRTINRVKKLVLAGADVNAENNENNTPLFLACTKAKDQHLVKALIDLGAEIKDEYEGISGRNDGNRRVDTVIKFQLQKAKRLQDNVQKFKDLIGTQNPSAARIARAKEKVTTGMDNSDIPLFARKAVIDELLAINQLNEEVLTKKEIVNMQARTKLLKK